MKGVIITGITGQTGSYLADILIKDGCEVHGLVRRASSFNRSRIEHLRGDPEIYGSSLHLHYADLSDSTVIRRLISSIKPHEFYHLAGQSHVGHSFEIPESTAKEVAFSTLSLLEIIRDLADPPRFFHASSAEVFGCATNFPQDENSPFRPANPYGCSKAFATQVASVYRNAFGLFICNGIMYNHESPRRSPSFVTRKVSLAAAAASMGSKEILRLGNLNAERDWGYALEYADLMIRMLRHDSPDDYVVSTGSLTSVRDFVRSAYESLGFRLSFEGSGSEEIGIDLNSGRQLVAVDSKYFRPVEPAKLVGNSAKARKVLGWTPSVFGTSLACLMAESDLDSISSDNNHC